MLHMFATVNKGQDSSGSYEPYGNLVQPQARKWTLHILTRKRPRRDFSLL